MLATLPTCGTLPASKTFAARRWTFVPSRNATQSGLGVLSIVQGRHGLDSYSLDTNDIGRGCVEVLFVRKDDSAEVYAVTCDRTGTPRGCTCPGHQFGHKKGIVCKHAQTVKELLADGVLALPVVAVPVVPVVPAKVAIRQPVHGTADLECF